MAHESQVLDLVRTLKHAGDIVELSVQQYTRIPWWVNNENMCAWVADTEIIDEKSGASHPATYVAVYLGSVYYAPDKEFRLAGEAPDWLITGMSSEHHLRGTCGVHFSLAYLPQMSVSCRSTLRSLIDERIRALRRAWRASMISTREVAFTNLHLRRWFIPPEDEDPHEDMYVKADCDEKDAHVTACIEKGRMPLPQDTGIRTYTKIDDVRGRQWRDTQQRDQSDQLIDAASWLRENMRRHQLSRGWVPLNYVQGGSSKIAELDGAYIRLLFWLCSQTVIYDFGAFYLNGYNKSLHRILNLWQLHVTPQPNNQPSVQLCVGDPRVPEVYPWYPVETRRILTKPT